MTITQPAPVRLASHELRSRPADGRFSGFCGLARLLAVMPWNRVKP